MAILAGDPDAILHDDAWDAAVSRHRGRDAIDGPTFQAAAGVYRVAWPEAAVEFRAVETSGHAIYALATARAGGRTLPDTGLNLTNDRARLGLAQAVERLAPAPNWRARVDDAVRLVLDAYREGDPAVVLASMPPQAVTDPFLVRPLVLRDEPTVLFGDGGSLKSRTALLAAATVALGRSVAPGLDAPSLAGAVIYADWEQSARVARDRLAAMCGKPPDGIVYLRCARPLVHEAERIARLAMDTRAVLLVVDSIGWSAHGPLVNDDVAADYFRALRDLGLPSLLVHHVSKAGDTHRPFGSAYWHNGARMTWYAELAGNAAGSNVTTITLLNRKWNDGPVFGPRGLAWTFQSDGGVTVTLGDAPTADLDDVSVPLRVRIRQALRAGAMTVAELADDLGAKPDTITRTLTRGKADGEFTQVGAHRWGLSA